ncbi:MAG TPA: T9SS type A sorting domain-containing protein, partial [Chitinophagales bacterium]|nr:T9SS type A sorting domain-containing protein [Chitinophagales bacterium]
YNSHLFEIERSLNGVGFETVGLVDAAGFSTIPKKYFYTDHDVSELGSTKIFYRLRMVDLDNTFSYSAVKWIDLEETADSSAITIFPNPVNDLLAVSLDVSSDQEALLQIIDVAGRVNSETAVVLKKGLNFIEADAGGLVAGLYMVRIVSGRNFYTARMVKQ